MRKHVITGILGAIVAFALIVGLAKAFAPKPDASPETASEKIRSSKVAKKTKKTTKLATKTNEKFRPYRDPKDIRKGGTWNKRSEAKKHPKINANERDLVLRVSLEGNRVYLLRKGKVIYTMLCSGGLYRRGKSLTPTGTFQIQGGRGANFFNYNLNEGANNWTSWSDNNVYLFHSVPTQADGSYNLKEAKKLGRMQGSHGCIRLSVPDSRWIMEKMPAGTKVVIKDH